MFAYIHTHIYACIKYTPVKEKIQALFYHLFGQNQIPLPKNKLKIASLPPPPNNYASKCLLLLFSVVCQVPNSSASPPGYHATATAHLDVPTNQNKMLYITNKVVSSANPTSLIDFQ